MVISIQESEELINVEFNGQGIVFFKNIINFIFINEDNTYDILILNNISKIQDFEKKKNKCIKYLIFVFEFNGDKNIIKYFEENFDFNFFNYINLKMYWYSLIYKHNNNDYIYEEEILPNIKDKLDINIETNIDLINYNQYKNLNLEINTFDKDITSLIDNIKYISLDELSNRKKQI